MSAVNKPLTSEDFPVHAEGDKLKKQNGTTIAKTSDPATAADAAGRLNQDECRREENKWSA